MKRQSSNHHFQANDITFICRWWDKLESNCLPGTRIRQLYDGLPTDPSSLRHYYYAAATFIGYSCSTNIHDCISTVLVLWVYTLGGKFIHWGMFVCLFQRWDGYRGFTRQRWITRSIKTGQFFSANYRTQNGTQAIVTSFNNAMGRTHL